jgi:hypothetical protein
MNDPLAQAYLKVIEEETSSGVVDSTKSQVGKTYGDSESEKKAKETVPSSSTEKVEKDIEDVEEAPAELTSDGADGELKSVKSEATNPFDALYNKVINEEMFDFSTEDNSLEPSMEDMSSEEMNEEEGEEEGEEEMDEEGQVTVTLDREMAQKLHDVLMAVLEGSSEEEVDDIEDFEDEGEEEMDEEMDEEVKEEAVEAEVHGHALVDQEKLEKGMTKHSNMEVKGAVPVSKKKAEVVKGKKADGTPEKCTDNPEELTHPSKMNTGGVKVGKSLFDQ